MELHLARQINEVITIAVEWIMVGHLFFVHLVLRPSARPLDIFALDLLYIININYMSSINYVMITKSGRLVRRPGWQEAEVL